MANLLLAVPYGLGAGGVDAALNNCVAIHYASRHMSWLRCMWGIGASAAGMASLFYAGITVGRALGGFLTMRFDDPTMIRIGQFVLLMLVMRSLLKNGRAKAIRFSTLDGICEALECQSGDVLEWVEE